MELGIATLSLVPLRREPAEKSEMVNQVLFGESFTILEVLPDWVRIELHHDSYTGWLDRKQFMLLDNDAIAAMQDRKISVSSELIELVSEKTEREHFPVLLGSLLPGLDENGDFILGNRHYHFSGAVSTASNSRKDLIQAAFHYLHAPYLWGGRTPFGIDCSGLVQMLYRQIGHNLPRDAYQQAEIGHTLSFIEESEPGDLAFFNNEAGKITHVGILLEDHHIIHASGKVRIDHLDQTGIFNRDKGSHTHKLRVIKKIL